MALNTGMNIELPLKACDIDLRDAFFDEVNRGAAADSDVLLLTDDQDAFSLGWLRDNLPYQYIHAGIAEQNLISVAAGLALAGKIPIIYGIATFMTMRCYEQIRDDLCTMSLPVTIVASGGGFGYSGDGPTHHAVQDVAIMRTIPNITILNPSDATSTGHFARLAHQEAGPKYVRIERGTVGRIYDNGHDFSSGMHVLSTGADLMLISTGIMVHDALQVVHNLAKHQVRAGLMDLYQLKPIEQGILSAAIGDAPAVVTLEEHSVVGGLGSLVSEVLTDSGNKTPLLRLGIPDQFTYSYGSRNFLRSVVGLDVDSVVSRILKFLGRE